MKTNINTLLQFCTKYEIKGLIDNQFFTHTKPILEAIEDTLTWISPIRLDKNELAQNTQSRIIFCDQSVAITKEMIDEGKCFIVVENPKLQFTKAVEQFLIEAPQFGIHATAVIHPEAAIGKNVFIGSHTYIGKCTIGENTFIYGNCYLYNNTIVGNNVTIHAGTVIGADGFGYSKNEAGEFVKFPHIGGVIIEDNVDIGANTCIDRGSLGNTHIKQGAKIDNLVHIAHNVIIGKNSAIIAHAMIGGSTVIDDDAWVAPNVAIRDLVTIGKNATIGLGAIVTKSIPANETWMGNPAKKYEKY
jgi:UDP-3-O-[3-hydroxymyristoyl] glucosamine N-acyltransferase